MADSPEDVIFDALWQARSSVLTLNDATAKSRAVLDALSAAGYQVVDSEGRRTDIDPATVSAIVRVAGRHLAEKLESLAKQVHDPAATEGFDEAAAVARCWNEAAKLILKWTRDG